jgi:hypothetical protein
MPIAARLFSMKYAARSCRTLKPLIAFSFLLRRMQPRDWPGALRNLRAVAAQMHRVGQAGLLHGLRDPAISLLLLSGFRRRQHQICRARIAEGFGERSRVAHGGRERFRALAHKALQSPSVAPPRRAPSSPPIAENWRWSSRYSRSPPKSHTWHPLRRPPHL